MYKYNLILSKTHYFLDRKKPVVRYWTICTHCRQAVLCLLKWLIAFLSHTLKLIRQYSSPCLGSTGVWGDGTSLRLLKCSDICCNGTWILVDHFLIQSPLNKMPRSSLGEVMTSITSITQDGACPDIAANGFLGGRFEKTYTFMYENWTCMPLPADYLKSQPATKNTAHEQSIREVEYASYTLLVLSATDGTATTFYKRLASYLRTKWDHLNSSSIYVLAEMPVVFFPIFAHACVREFNPALMVMLSSHHLTLTW